MIKVEKGIVKIFYPDDSTSAYEFSLDRAGEKYSNTNQSDWIIHMAGKTWVTMSMLIELTKILKVEAPQLDWEESLKFAERIKRE